MHTTPNLAAVLAAHTYEQIADLQQQITDLRVQAPSKRTAALIEMRSSRIEALMAGAEIGDEQAEAFQSSQVEEVEITEVATPAQQLAEREVELVDALSCLPAGLTLLDERQTAWMRRTLGACGVPAQANTPSGRVWCLDLEGDRDEVASARISIPTRGCGSVLMFQPSQYEEQIVEVIQAAPAMTNTTNGGRAIALELLARLANRKAA